MTSELMADKEGAAAHVILSQGVSNAQGPDKMVMIVHKKGGEVQLILDLYQCKNFTDFKKDFRETWFHTVGLQLDNGKMQSSENGIPAYCDFYARSLVEQVGAAMVKQGGAAKQCTGSIIRYRVVVVPQSADEVVKACQNSNNSLSAAGELLSAVESSDGNVLLWTSDCLRPTIRVIKLAPGE